MLQQEITIWRTHFMEKSGRFSCLQKALILGLLLLVGLAPWPFASAAAHDIYEPDNTRFTANFLMLNTQKPAHHGVSGYEWRQFHDFHEQGDQDWVKIYLLSGRIIRYKITVDQAKENCDAVIELFNNNGALLDSANSGLAGEKEFLEFEPTYDGWHFVRITNHDGEYGADTNYRLMLTEPSGTIRGFIKGRIDPVPPVTRLTTNGKGIAMSYPNGYYYMPHEPGDFILYADIQSYAPFSTPVTVPENGFASVLIQLQHTITAIAGPNGSISPSGEVPVNHEGDETFTITPDDGYVIADVKVDDESVGAVSEYTFYNVTAGHTIKALFGPIAIPTHTINADAGQHGSISPSGAMPVNHGADETFTITPDDGCKIDDVTVDGSSVGAVASYTFYSVSEDHSISASFKVAPHTIPAGAVANGTISPSDGVSVDDGVDQTFTITAADGYVIDDVTVDGSSVGAVASYTFHNVAEDHSISATFKVAPHAITAAAGANGTISPSDRVSVDDGVDQTFTITAADGYVIDNVTVDGSSVGAVASYTFHNVAEDHSISASFKVGTHTIMAIARANGSVSPSGAVTVPLDGNKIFAITPNAGYEIADVRVDGFSVGAVTSYAFEKVRFNHVLEASFRLKIHTIIAGAGANGSISPSGGVTVSHGKNRKFTITSNVGYEVAVVRVDGGSVGAVLSYTFENVTSDHAIEAGFKEKFYTITTDAGAGGGITPSDDAETREGSDKVFFIIPDKECIIEDVKEDGNSLGVKSIHAFRNVAADHTIEASFDCEGPFYVITAGVGPGGGIFPSGDLKVKEGASKTFTITPGAGYAIDDLKVDEESVGIGNSYTFPNVTSAHTIKATFALDGEPLSHVMPDIKTNGSDGPIVASPADSISLAINLASDYREGLNADWWIVARTSFATPFDFFSYINPGQWAPGIARMIEAPLTTVDNVDVSSLQLPVGDYRFYFGVVDSAENSVDGTWYDFVDVHVVE